MPRGYIKDLCRLEGVPLLIYQHALLRMQYIKVSIHCTVNGLNVVLFFPFNDKNR